MHSETPRTPAKPLTLEVMNMTDRIIYIVTFIWVACLWAWLGVMWIGFIS